MNKYQIMKGLLLTLLIVSVWWILYSQPYINHQTVNMLSSVEQKHEVIMEATNYYGTSIGFYAQPADDGEYPGVVMIHEWWGLNENIRLMAEQLAGQGYKVLAVDLYDGSVAGTPDEARKLVTSIDQAEANKNLQAAVEFLREENASKVGSLGWCFGGGQSMQLAVSGADLDATVIYYGNVVSDEEQLQSIQWPVLGIFGAEDQAIPVDSVRAFEVAANDVGIDNEIHIYPGVGHAFANPSGGNYAPEETMDAWEKTLDFLMKNLQ